MTNQAVVSYANGQTTGNNDSSNIQMYAPVPIGPEWSNLQPSKLSEDANFRQDPGTTKSDWRMVCVIKSKPKMPVFGHLEN